MAVTETPEGKGSWRNKEGPGFFILILGTGGPSLSAYGLPPTMRSRRIGPLTPFRDGKVLGWYNPIRT